MQLENKVVERRFRTPRGDDVGMRENMDIFDNTPEERRMVIHGEKLQVEWVPPREPIFRSGEWCVIAFALGTLAMIMIVDYFYP